MNSISKILLLFSSKEKGRLLIIFFYYLFGVFLDTIGIGMVIPVVSILANPEYATKLIIDYSFLNFMIELNQKEIFFLSISFLFSIYIIKNFFLIFIIFQQQIFCYTAQKNISYKLFKKYLNQPYSFILNNDSSKLIRNATLEAQNINGSVSALLSLFAEITLIIILTIMMFYFEPLVSLSLFLTIFLIFILYYFFTNKILYEWGKRRQEAEGKKIELIQQGLEGIKEVKMYSLENFFLNNFSLYNDKVAKIGSIQISFQVIPRYWIEIIAILFLSIVLYILFMRNFNVSSVLPVIAFYAAAGFRLLPSLARITGAIQIIKYNLATLNLVNKHLKLKEDNYFRKGQENIYFSESITIKDVVFKYENSKNNIIKNLNLKIKFGEKIGIYGSSGAGKTTLLNLLIGLLKPTEGSILVDDFPIEKNIRGWQNIIGYVPQNIFLISDTLKRNIAFGQKDENIDEILLQNSIQKSNLNSFINRSENKLETLIGERGIKISGGQKQRIGIARTIYRKSRIIIFDEATNSLDKDSEKDILETIYSLEDVTIIVISHDKKVFYKCDKVYKIEEGKIDIIRN